MQDAFGVIRLAASMIRPQASEVLHKLLPDASTRFATGVQEIKHGL